MALSSKYMLTYGVYNRSELENGKFPNSDADTHVQSWRDHAKDRFTMRFDYLQGAQLPLVLPPGGTRFRSKRPGCRIESPIVDCDYLAFVLV
jgi:hypothetical protein